MFSSVYFRQEKEEGSQSPLKVKDSCFWLRRQERKGGDGLGALTVHWAALDAPCWCFYINWIFSNWSVGLGYTKPEGKPYSINFT